LLPAAIDSLPRFVFINGRYCAALSADPALLAGGSLRSPGAGAANAASSIPAASNDAGAALAAGSDERFAWINTAFAPDAAQLAVHGELQLELLFVALPDGGGGASYPRLQISLAPGARLSLVERHLGSGGHGALIAATVEIELAANSQAVHYRLQSLADDAGFMDTLLADVGADAEYRVFLLQQGAVSSRSASHLRLTGARAQLQVSGMSLAGQQRSLDTAIRVEHLARDARSDQVLRAIANDRARIAFNSRVEVATAAGGADSRQSLKGLIGSSGAEVNLRPQLEINTDEVRASHGATTGALDESTLFYLLSRGLAPGEARMLLEWAFMEDVLSRIGIPALRKQVERATVDRLSNAAQLEALL
ncbi:MAG: SufD family Fe-S cluster assembly protein, partial [Pseudomonadota bacterium]